MQQDMTLYQPPLCPCPPAPEILLVCTLGVFLPFIFLVLWPHVAKLRGDAARQSALLSHVPPEVDTLGHVRATCRRAKAGREARAGAAAKRSILGIGGGRG